MKQERNADVLLQGIKYLLAIGMLVGALAVLAYINKFAPGHWFEFSNSQDIWGAFGDYIGGVLNPVFSFLAFFGVLLTVLLQAKQLDIARDQAQFEELQRVLAGVSSQIDRMLGQTPNYYAAKDQVRRDVAPLTLFDHISAFGTQLLTPTEQSEFDAGFYEATTRGVREDIKLMVNALALELHCLGWALEKYVEQGGSGTVVEFYKLRYGAIATWLDAMGAIDAQSRIRNVMDLDLLRKAMTPEAKGQP